jgi:hypothetical protein
MVTLASKIHKVTKHKKIEGAIAKVKGEDRRSDISRSSSPCVLYGILEVIIKPLGTT